MAVNAPIRFFVPSKDESYGRFAMKLIESFGSLEFAIGVSRDVASETFIRELRLMTNGLLVFNAVLFDGGNIRVPGSPEGELLEKKWKVPIRWLSLESVGRRDRFSRSNSGAVYPAHLLQTVLYQNRISVLMSADRKITGLSPGEIPAGTLDGSYGITPAIHAEDETCGVPLPM
ncbi:MAG: hypothetical protein ACYC9S_13440 [Leptospirales bacterium]